MYQKNYISLIIQKTHLSYGIIKKDSFYITISGIFLSSDNLANKTLTYFIQICSKGIQSNITLPVKEYLISEGILLNRVKLQLEFTK